MCFTECLGIPNVVRGVTCQPDDVGQVFCHSICDSTLGGNSGPYVPYVWISGSPYHLGGTALLG